MMPHRWQRITLLSVLGYEGDGALLGGSLLIAVPDGQLMGMPVDIMHGVFVGGVVALPLVPARDATILEAPLVCGIVAALLYVPATILGAMRYAGYSSTSYSVSELFAIDAPSKSLVDPLLVAYSVLWIAFGVGVWLSAGRTRALRIAAAGLIGKEVEGVVVQLFFPMHQRGVAVTSNDPVGTYHHLRIPALASGIAFGLAGGFMEELGWTGFAISRLLVRYRFLACGLIVGPLWGAWHLLQMWWVGRTSPGSLPFAVFLPVYFVSAGFVMGRPS
jgi:membrane protease YdiL (CAAX protease family)